MDSRLQSALKELSRAIEGVNAHSDDTTGSQEQMYKFTTKIDERLGCVCAALERNSELCKREGFYGEADRLDFHVGVCIHVINMNKDAMIGYTIGMSHFIDKLRRKEAMLLKVNQVACEYTKERPAPLHPDPEYLAGLDDAVRKWEAVVGGLRGKYMDIFQRVTC